MSGPADRASAKGRAESTKSAPDTEYGGYKVFSPESTVSPLTGWKPAVIGLLGGSLTGLVVALALLRMAPLPVDQELQTISADQVEMAAQSLLASRAASIAEEAKSCKRPLAYLVIQATNKAVGSLRVRSGDYVTPNVQLGPSSLRVALPLPAPLEVGHGQIEIENRSDGAEVFLVPGVRTGPGPTSRVVDVHWDPKGHC